MRIWKRAAPAAAPGAHESHEEAKDIAGLEDNPHYWLAAYGVRSHYFCWAVAHGALDDIDPPRRSADWLQPPLLPDCEPMRPPPSPPRRVYRSRAPNKRDVAAEDMVSRRLRAMLGIRLRDEWVLK